MQTLPPFTAFSSAIAAQINSWTDQPIYTVDLDPNEVYSTYLASFPEGTNPIYKTNTNHDCSCCKQFIRQVGNLVVINPDLSLTSIWDVEVPYPYNIVAKRLSALVKSCSITGQFFASKSFVGQQQTIQYLPPETRAWDHFYCFLPGTAVSSKPATSRANLAGAFAAITRSFEDLNSEAVAAVIDLIQTNQLYRGTDSNLKTLLDFQTVQSNYHSVPSAIRARAAWACTTNQALRLRNTSIGQLILNISKGMPVDQAVNAYERMVAPANYRRTTAPITQNMVAKASTTLEQMGLSESIPRRIAHTTDLNITDILWANRSAAQQMTNSLQALLADEIVSTNSAPKGATTLPIEKFITNILPTTRKLEILFEPQHQGNLVTLTTASNPKAPPLFTWPSPIAWAYRGDVTDSIKERVKAAGGRIDAYVRVSLSWFNTDDLDLHCHTATGQHIYYSRKVARGTECNLDVDMNVSGESRSPVENITWPRFIEDGIHEIEVHNYHKRESTDVGFEIEIATPTETLNLSHTTGVQNDQTVPVATLKAKRGQVSITPHSHMDTHPRTTTEWGLKTSDWHEVSLVTLSPNHWDSPHGNKHWFFIIPGCASPEPIRGFYNEFLTPQLLEHRKVFEVLGAKTMCEPDPNGLAGLGYSSTIRNTLTVKADNRPYTLTI